MMSHLLQLVSAAGHEDQARMLLCKALCNGCALRIGLEAMSVPCTYVEGTRSTVCKGRKAYNAV